MSDEAFTRLVSGIGSMVSQTAMGQPPQQTISDFLNTLGEGYSTGEGMVCIMKKMWCFIISFKKSYRSKKEKKKNMAIDSNKVDFFLLKTTCRYKLV